MELAGEIGVARRVDQVDLGFPPFQGSDGGADGDAALDLVGIEVGDRVALFDPAEARRGLRVEQQRLDQRGLAGAAVAEHADGPIRSAGYCLTVDLLQPIRRARPDAEGQRSADQGPPAPSREDGGSRWRSLRHAVSGVAS
jgi:hypothetical protein